MGIKTESSTPGEGVKEKEPVRTEEKNVGPQIIKLANQADTHIRSHQSNFKLLVAGIGMKRTEILYPLWSFLDY